MSETIFQGTSAIALDAKGRITVPVRQRDLLMQACEGRLTLTKTPGGYLWLLPRDTWLSRRKKMIALPYSAEGWRRVFIGSAVDVEIDTAARISVPPELRAAAGLSKDVLLIGNGEKFELWDAGRHAAHETQLMTEPIPPQIQDMVF